MSDGAPIKSGQYAAKKAEYAKSSIRAKVEHVFGVVKKQLHFRKTRYRGLEKQQAKFNIMFAPAGSVKSYAQICFGIWQKSITGGGLTAPWLHYM